MPFGRPRNGRVMAFAIAAGIGILPAPPGVLQKLVAGDTRLPRVCLQRWRAVCCAALAAGGGIVSLGSIVGFIAVLGIAVRNTFCSSAGIGSSRITKAKRLAPRWLTRATEERSASILMSAIVTALALLPFALFGNIAGLEIAHPMAVVVLGGLVTTTLVSLVGVPAMYAVCGAAVSEPDMELADEMPASAGGVGRDHDR